MLITWAHLAVRRGNRRLAAILSYLATLLHPRTPESWLVRARAYGTSGRDDAAAAALSRGLRRTPHSLELKVELADRLISKGDIPAARELLNDAGREDPKSAAVLSGLAYAARQEGDLSTARQLALKARGRASASPSQFRGVLGGIGYLLAELPGAESDAIETLKMAAEAEPDDPRPHMLLAALLVDKDDQAASNHVQRALATWGGGQRTLEAEIEKLRIRLRHQS